MHPSLLLAAFAQETADKTAPAVELDPISLIMNASGVVMVVVWLLIFTAISVWFIAVLKLMQLSRWSRADRLFEAEVARKTDPDELFAAATRHPTSAAARVLLEMQKRRDQPKALEATAKRAMVDEQKKASSMMSLLASIGSATPFIGLFGTVWGIMDAFLRIGREKTASLPVVAPAIGEALIATAIGLLAAIPAVIAYNAISKRLDDLLAAIETSAEAWAQLIGHAEPDWKRATAQVKSEDRALLLTRPRPPSASSPPHHHGG